MTEQEFTARFLDIFGHPRNKRPDLAPGGWWETRLFALSWMPPHRPLSLLIRNTSNRQFGPFEGLRLSSDIPLFQHLTACRDRLAADIQDPRITFRERCQLHALLAP